MDLATINDRREVEYYSDVPSNNSEELERLYARVSQWTHDVGITALGEGTVEVREYEGRSAYSHTYLLRAPIASGNTAARADMLLGCIATKDR